MIDNYDSFTFNLVHYFQALGQDVLVKRNDQISLSDIKKLAPQYIVISPGPCDPNSAGLSLSIIHEFKGLIPILGVCLGHQCIAQAFGATITKAKQVMHGKTSLITHNNTGLFTQLNNPLKVTRYHSLIVEQATLSNEFEINAWTTTTENKIAEIMAITHKKLPLVGVQFHPESVLTEQGHLLLNNFLQQYSS